MDLKTKLEELAMSSIVTIEETESLKEVEELRVKLLGKKGQLTDLLKMMRDLSKEERPVIGKLANEIRDDLTARIGEKKEALEIEALNERLAAETIDVTLPGRPLKKGQTCHSSSDGRDGGFIFRHGLQHYRRNRNRFGLLKLRTC